MSFFITIEDNERTRLIDAGEKFIIPQYIHFFLITLEEVLQQPFIDRRDVSAIMIPLNKGFEKLVKYLKTDSYSRRHVDDIIEDFNEGYVLAIEKINHLSNRRYERLDNLVHIIISKMCHLVRYEQRYLVHHTDMTSMLNDCSWDNLFCNTRLDIDEITCKSKENLEFCYSQFYVSGCQQVTKLIHLLLTSLYYEDVNNWVSYLMYQVRKLHEGMQRLYNLEQYIAKNRVISRLYIRKELSAVRYYYNSFKNAYINAMVKYPLVLTHMELVQILKSIAVDIASLGWGLYFLTMLYGSSGINQFGEIKVYG